LAEKTGGEEVRKEALLQSWGKQVFGRKGVGGIGGQTKTVIYNKNGVEWSRRRGRRLLR